MSMLTKSQYQTVAAVVDGVRVQCTERDLDVLEASGLLSLRHWMSNGQHTGKGERLGWLTGLPTGKARELVAKHGSPA